MCLGMAVLLAMNAFAQVKFFPRNNNLEQWYLSDENRDMKAVSRILMNFPEVKTAVSSWEGDTSAMLSQFHWIDFDRNLCPDILFNGKIGNKDYIFLFKNLDDSDYLLVLELPGCIIQANQPTDAMPFSISVWNGNCCGDKVSFHSRWTCMVQGGKSFMQMQEQGLVYAHTLLPDAGMRATGKMRFEIKNYAAILRMTPFLDDDTRYDGQFNWRGNGIVTYPQGYKGVIFHEVTNKDGKWYFVRMDNGAGVRLHSDRFRNSEEVENPNLYYYYGWIHEGNVRLLE